MRLFVQNDLGTLKAVQSVNTDQAAPTFFDDGKRVFGSPFPCNVAASRAECSGDALVHMEQQNVAERSVLNVRHHKLGTVGSLCFLLGDCRETASQMVQHIQPPDGAGDKQKRQQQRAALARILVGKPRILMLDEPSMGLSPLLVQEIFDIIRDIHKEGMTILLVEQNAQMALSVADRAYVLETGRVVMEGTGAELLTNERVRSAYLGG